MFIAFLPGLRIGGFTPGHNHPVWHSAPPGRWPHTGAGLTSVPFVPKPVAPAPDADCQGCVLAGVPPATAPAPDCQCSTQRAVPPATAAGMAIRLKRGIDEAMTTALPKDRDCTRRRRSWVFISPKSIRLLSAA